MSDGRQANCLLLRKCKHIHIHTQTHTLETHRGLKKREDGSRQKIERQHKVTTKDYIVPEALNFSDL